MGISPRVGKDGLEIELQVGAVEEIRVEPAGLESGKNRLRASGLGTGGGG